MILNDGTEWQPDAEDVEKWRGLYPAVDVDQELRAMEGWLDANPGKRKTKVGVKRFVNSWLSRSQDRGGSSPAGLKDGALLIKSRDMTTLDELTHNFVDDPGVREFFISKHGQSFEGGKRVTR